MSPVGRERGREKTCYGGVCCDWSKSFYLFNCFFLFCSCLRKLIQFLPHPSAVTQIPSTKTELHFPLFVFAIITFISIHTQSLNYS